MHTSNIQLCLHLTLDYTQPRSPGGGGGGGTLGISGWGCAAGTLEPLTRGMNRGMQIRRSVVFLGPIRRSDLIFVQIRIRVTLKSFRGI